MGAKGKPNEEEICWLANQSHTTTNYASLALYNLKQVTLETETFL